MRLSLPGRKKKGDEEGNYLIEATIPLTAKLYAAKITQPGCLLS
jgi:hypothetical protein